MQSPEDHPEGDVLYHSLQVFELARQKLPYDEEFLLAALLHDVGKAVDRRNHVAAGLEMLAGAVSPRTAWLIEHHVEALMLREGTLGVRLRRRLEAAEDFDELMLLAACDRQGRAVGRDTPDVREALQYVRELAEMCGESSRIISALQLLDLALRQRLLQLPSPFGGHFGLHERERLEVRQTAELHQAGVGDFGLVEVQGFQARHFAELFQAGVANLGVGKVQILEILQGRQRLQAGVGNAGMPKVEPLQFGKSGHAAHGLRRWPAFPPDRVSSGPGRLSVGPSPPPEMGVSRTASCFRRVKPFHRGEAVVADVVAAEDAEVFQVGELLQNLQPGSR